MVEPRLVIAGGVTLVAVVAVAGRGVGAAVPSPGGPQIVTGETPGGWRWPLPVWQGRRPVVSDGWGSPRDGGVRRHRGADVGFKRARGELPELVAGTRQASPGGLYVCPDGLDVLAMRDGEVWSVTYTDRGILIVVSHGKPWATMYQHLRSSPWPARKGAGGGPRVRAGQPLGKVGNGHNPGTAPANAYNHPHVEFWHGGAAESAIDPGPLLARATHGPPAP